MALSQKQFNRIAKALADPQRFNILARIAGTNELACSDLRDELSITPATLSHHIKDLIVAGLVEERREGKFMYMKVRRAVWNQYLEKLGSL